MGFSGIHHVEVNVVDREKLQQPGKLDENLGWFPQTFSGNRDQ
jgi:hypothetical protein